MALEREPCVRKCCWSGKARQVLHRRRARGNSCGRSCRVFTDHRSILHSARMGRAAAACAASTASIAAAITVSRSLTFRLLRSRRTRGRNTRRRARLPRPVGRSLQPLAMHVSRARTGRSRGRTRRRRVSRWLDTFDQFPSTGLLAARSCGPRLKRAGVRIAVRPPMVSTGPVARLDSSALWAWSRRYEDSSNS
jgi:hypothetical protein